MTLLPGARDDLVALRNLGVGIHADDAASALSAGLAGLVAGLHLKGVAEGVESEVQHRVLLEHGWSHAQGFLYGPPHPDPASRPTPATADGALPIASHAGGPAGDETSSGSGAV